MLDSFGVDSLAWDGDGLDVAIGVRQALPVKLDVCRLK